MHVLVNLVHLDPPSNGGASRIAREVCRLLAQHARSRNMRVTYAVGSAFAAQFAEWIGDADVEVVPCLANCDIAPWLRSLPVSLIVSPLFGAEPFRPANWPVGVQHLASMPDAQALDMPDLFNPDEARQRRKTYASLKQVNQVITISAHARQQLIYHLGLQPEQVSVAPLGTDINSQSEAVPPTVNGPYLYYPANDWPHKRHRFLLQIMEHVWRERPELKLVLSGGHRRDFVEELTAHNPAAAERIIDVGYVSEAQLVGLYRQAEAMLFTSSYEGFGMPLVEAMACRCPVICSRVTSIPEVAGDAALSVDSDDPARWAEVVLRTLPAVRTRYIERGERRAAEFTWERMRNIWESQLLAAYEAATVTYSPHEQQFTLAQMREELLRWSRSVRDLQRAADERQRLIVSVERTADQRLTIIRELEAALTDCQLRLDALQQQNTSRGETIAVLQATADERLSAINSLSQSAADRMSTINELSRVADERLEAIQALRQTADERLGAIQLLRETADERLETVEVLSLTADERLSVIHELQRAADERLQVIHVLQTAAEERLEVIHKLQKPPAAPPPITPPKTKLRLFRRKANVE